MWSFVCVWGVGWGGGLNTWPVRLRCVEMYTMCVVLYDCFDSRKSSCRRGWGMGEGTAESGVICHTVPGTAAAVASLCST